MVIKSEALRNIQLKSIIRRETTIDPKIIAGIQEMETAEKEWVARLVNTLRTGGHVIT
jgi:hypothetical protein